MAVIFLFALSALFLNLEVFGDDDNNWKNDPRKNRGFPLNKESPFPNYKKYERKLEIPTSGSFKVLEKRSTAENDFHSCGGIIENINGTISSPSFPDLYPANKNCIWEIIAQPQHKIMLNFTHFDLEETLTIFKQDCEYDSVDIRSKMGENEVRKHGVFCGSTLPPAITSEGSNLRIQFSSDDSVQKSGFAAVFFTDKDECATNNGGCQQICKNNIGSYTCACNNGFVIHENKHDCTEDKDECATNNGGCQHICKNNIGSYTCVCNNGFVIHENKHDCKEGSCTHKITTSQGKIVSPNYPESYPSKKDCSWTFTTTPGHRIKLVFHEFELEPHPECAYDHIAIYDGDSTDSPILGRFCGSKTPHPMLASSNRMFMVFKSDFIVQRKGFMAAHSTVCGGRLVAVQTVEHLYSHSKYGDQDYDNKEHCDWVIEAAEGHRVLLRFLTFELEHGPDCGYDYVEIYDGYDDSSTLVGKYCGNKVPPEFISTGDNVLLRFRSDDTVIARGFSAAYQEVDSGEDEERHEKFHFSY